MKLIKLDRLADAKSVLDQAKDKGAKGNSFDQLETKLLEVEPTVTVGSQNQDPPQDELKSLIDLYNQDQCQETLSEAKRLLQQFPNSAILCNICGVASKSLGQLNTAVDRFKQAIKINPHYADGYYNMGNALREQGKRDEAIEAYTKALSIKPNYAEAYNNMGIAFKEQGKLKEAIEVYNKALSIKPDYADAYNNMGDALKGQGTLAEAISKYEKALLIKPNFAEALSNMGIALMAKGKLNGARKAYNKALDLNPNYAEAAWNLSSSAKNISEAKHWIEQCLNINQDHLKAKLILSALKFYEGDNSEFNKLMQSTFKDDPYMRSFSWAFNLPELPELYFHRWALFDAVIKKSIKDRPFYEYGVWRGEAFRYLTNTFKKGYGFDTFEGLPEAWHEEGAGSYSSDGNIPQIKGGEFIVGKFEDTLPEFFSEPRPLASVINFDADLYSSTICSLNHSKPVIDSHTILIFDEFIMNKNWEEDEYKALNEFCLENNCTYDVLAISFSSKQVAVKLIGI